jgi:Cu/Ag efflux pump CusA
VEGIAGHGWRRPRYPEIDEPARRGSAKQTLAELRAIQHWVVRYQLTKAEGVAEVASVGGFVKQYEVVVGARRVKVRVTVPARCSRFTWSHIGSEFMPTLNEGTLFYMPVSLPSMSITKAAELLQTQDRIIKTFPEVESVFGKAGRANTATDPAPTEMFETVINLRPESEWRPGMTVDQLVSDMNRTLEFPGVSNAWTMPIKARIDMLSTGIRTPVGVKVYGADLAEIDRLAKEIEAVVRTVPGTTSAFAERVLGGYYLNIEPDRAALDRYWLTINDVQEVVQTALGGEMVTSTVEGRERFSVNVRYPRGLRDDPQAVASQVLVNASDGTAIPLGQVASIKITQGAPSIRTENAQLVDYIYVDLQGRDPAMSPTRSVQCASRSSFRRATISNGADSSNISNAPRPGFRPSSRLPSSSFSCCST